VVPQGLDVLFSFILFGDFRSLLLAIFLERFRGLSLWDLVGGCMYEPFVVLFPLIPVTEPLKLIPYYCLKHSPWPLSNNIEVTCRLCRVKPGKSLTS
jgi:hypothetical protein